MQRTTRNPASNRRIGRRRGQCLLDFHTGEGIEHRLPALDSCEIERVTSTDDNLCSRIAAAASVSVSVLGSVTSLSSP
jgi:hypothetical protein